MKIYDLEEDTINRDEIKEHVVERAKINPVTRLSNTDEEVSHLKIFIGAGKQEYRFRDIGKPVFFQGKLEDRVEERDPTEAKMELLATRLVDEPKDKHFEQLVDSIMSIVENRCFEVPLHGNKNGESVRVGTKIVQEVKFIGFEELE